MGKFAWFVTIKNDLIGELRARIAQSAHRKLGSLASAAVHLVHKSFEERVYFDSSGIKYLYRTAAARFPTKEAAENFAFKMTGERPELIGMLSVERLWYEPPEIIFRSNPDYGRNKH